MADTDKEPSARVLLGIELRRLRMGLGMSQRRLARQLGLRAHSTLVDYEQGRRIPPAEIAEACERLFRTPEGQLQHMRRKALAENAREWRAAQLARLGLVAGERADAPPVLKNAEWARLHVSRDGIRGNTPTRQESRRAWPSR